MSNVPRTVLMSLGYAVVHPVNEFWQVTLHGKRLNETFEDEQQAWEYAMADLSLRTTVDMSGANWAAKRCREEAIKRGFEVTCVPAQSPRYGWRNRDLEACSIRTDYASEDIAWRAAYLWAKRFNEIWKECL